VLQLRVALTSHDLERLERFDEPYAAHGATVVHPPVATPWGDRNVRLQDPEGLQVKLFEETDQVPGSDA